MKITNRQAIEAQFALTSLIAMNLPVKSSWGIAQLSTVIDRQVLAFAKARDALIKNYQIKLKVGEKDNSTVFTTLIGGEDSEEAKKLKENALTEFTDKMNELVMAEMDDITIKVSLPGNIGVRPDVLKPVLSFVTIEGENA